MNNVEEGRASIEEGSKIVLLFLSLLCYEVRDGTPLTHQILRTSPWSRGDFFLSFFLLKKKKIAKKRFLKTENSKHIIHEPCSQFSIIKQLFAAEEMKVSRKSAGRPAPCASCTGNEGGITSGPAFSALCHLYSLGARQHVLTCACVARNELWRAETTAGRNYWAKCNSTASAAAALCSSRPLNSVGWCWLWKSISRPAEVSGPLSSTVGGRGNNTTGLIATSDHSASGPVIPN